MNRFTKVLQTLRPHDTHREQRLDTQYQTLIAEITSRNLTYLSNERLSSIAKTCNNLESRKVSGILVEAGCALGGSAILIALTKNTARPFYIYDMFGMIPPPTDEDGPDVHERYQMIISGESQGIRGDKYYGYEEDLYQIVLGNLAQFNIHESQNNVKLIKGLLHETMIIDQSVAFAHIDVDWYDSVKVSLERIIPKLVVSGSVILDDYNTWSGCRKAADEYFSATRNKFQMDDTAGSMKITKLR